MKKLLILLMTLFCCATAFAADARQKACNPRGHELGNQHDA